MLAKTLRNHQLQKNANLISCSYSYGGGMMGGFQNVSINKDKDGKITITSQSKKIHNERATIKTCEGSEDDLKNIKDLFFKYSLDVASKKPQNPIQAMDADTASMSFTFDGYNYFNVSETLMLSKSEYQGMIEIRDYLYSVLNNSGAESYLELKVVALIANGYWHSFELNDSKAADQFYEDYLGKYHFKNDNKLFFELTNELDISDCPLAKGEAGTIVYNQTDKQIIIYYDNFEPYDSLYELGKLKDNNFDMAILKELVEGDYFLNVGN